VDYLISNLNPHIKNTLAIFFGGAIVAAVGLLLILFVEFLAIGNKIFKYYDDIREIDGILFGLVFFFFSAIIFIFSFFLIIKNNKVNLYLLLSLMSGVHFLLYILIAYLSKFNSLGTKDLVLSFSIGLLLNFIAFRKVIKPIPISN
jgi:hypothetical protein